MEEGRVITTLYTPQSGAWNQSSSVDIANRYGLDGPEIESPVGARFSAPVHTGSETHPPSYRMGTGSFPGVKRPRRGVEHSTPSSSEVKERVQL
jgi:hypothetical protein